MTDKELHVYCLDWAAWCQTRRFYVKPGSQNVLARMQPSRSGREPNARNHADMPYFNMAVHALSDMGGNTEELACFTLFYVDQADNVKREADKLGIARSTYYRRVMSFARKAHSMSISIKRVHESHFPPSAGAAQCGCGG